MAAVQRTPTPVDLSSRRAFIESMEEELKRVQDHLDRRQWRQRNRSSTQQPQWYSNSLRGNRRRLWDQRDKENEDEDSDEVFCRVSSAQDTVRRSSVSSCSSRSPTSSPETIRVKSPRRLPSTNYANIPSFSSPVRGFTSPVGGSSTFPSSARTISSPLSALSPREYPVSVKMEEPLSPTGVYKNTVIDNTPMMVKEMAYAFRDSIFNNEEMLGYDAEEDEVDEDKETQEVMPSALDDLYTGEGTDGRQENIVSEISAASTSAAAVVNNNNVQSNINKGHQHSRIPSSSEIEIKSIPKTLTSSNANNGSIVKSKDHSVSYEKSRLEQLRRMKELREEKVHSDKQLSSIIEQLQVQLREKEKDFEALQAQHLVELNVREDRIKKLSRQNARLEREKWDLLKRAREAAERSVNLRTKLDMNDASMRSLQSELDRSSDELAAVKSANNSLRSLVKELKTRKPVTDVSTQVDLVTSLIMSTPTDLLIKGEDNEESDSGHASVGGGHVLSEDWSERISITSSQCDARETTPTNSFPERHGRERRSMKNLLKFRFRRSASAGKRHSTSSLSQVNTSSLDNLQLSQTSLTVPSTGSSRSHSPNPHRRSAVSLHDVTPDSQTVLQEFQNVPFPQWNTKAIIAWMEIVVGMPQYISTVRQYVTSGYAMLALSNNDMEKKLQINHSLHRRRLRLAIEDLRSGSSSNTKFPEVNGIDHNWVAYTWAVDCGLPHLSGTLYNGMVNGRVLNSITRDDLKKYLKVTKKVEQLSFLSGIELLRMHDFNIESIKSHHDTTSNPLYWNNKDICEWLKRINLEEYAGNVIGCGVHGALLFLERSYFTSELLANIVRIPTKSPLRKHLASQLAKLFSTEEINSYVEDIDDEQRDDQLTPHEQMSPMSLEHSPHPSRRMITQACSIPDLSDEAYSSNGFDRSHAGRRSLRESMLRAVNLPPSSGMVRQSTSANRQSSQLVSTTVV